MGRSWQLLLLAGALLAPTGAWADDKDGNKQRRERSERGRVWDDFGYGRSYPRNSESEKEWRKEQKERDKDRREAWREREKDRREAARESEKDRREAQREWEKDRAEATRDARDREYRYPRSRTRVPLPLP